MACFNLPMMKKDAIRKIYKEKRLQLTTPQINRLNDLMLIGFQKLVIDIPSLIMTYSPIIKLKEFDPQLITDYCYFKNPGQQLFYPVINCMDDKEEMRSVIVDDNTIFETNKFGIDEPVDGIDMFAAEIDLVIVPLLCFDVKGNRVGYGKGYYDRFLKQCRKDCIKIGFSYFDAIEEMDDLYETDVKIDHCITPHHIFTF